MKLFLREAIAAERREFQRMAGAARVAQFEADDFKSAMED